MSSGDGSRAESRYGPWVRFLWGLIAVLAPPAALWAFIAGDPNDVLFSFGVVMAAWSAVADAELRLPDQARVLTGITLVLGIVVAAVGLLIAPFPT